MAATFSTDSHDNTTETGEFPASVRGSYNTIRRSPKNTWHYSTRMTLSFAMTAVMTAAILVMVLAFVWEGQFQSYTRQNMQRVAESTAETVSQRYAEAGTWAPEVVEAVTAASALSDDIGVQLVDAKGNILYDDTWAITSRITGRTTGIGAEKGETKPGGQSDSASTSAPVPKPEVSLMPTDADSIVFAYVTDANDEVVGTVRLWAFGSEALLTKSDAAFRTNSYRAIGWAAAVAIALACLIGWAVARALTKPIKRITSTAGQIRNGDLTARTGLSGDDEIGRLGETFDEMATSLERDIKLEHRLTSDVAHELRTPLMAMQATVEAMQDGVLPADDEHFEALANEVRRLSKLVEAMLHLSRIENGTNQLETERTDLVYMVSSLVSAQHQLFHEKGLHLRFNDETGEGILNADINPDMISEAVVNLLSNAMRYTKPDGWVVVTVAQERQDALISVADTGIGIAKEDIPRTFSRFWRSDASREMETGGLGVGLSLTKEIIDRHNGTISVDSEVGKGTTFTLRIPLTRKKPRQNRDRDK